MQAQNAAKDKAIDARLEGVSTEIETLSGIGWGLAWAEYWRRTKQWDMVAANAHRSKSDQHGNKWSVQSLPRIAADASEDQIKALETLADALGYDPYDPPSDEAFLIHCKPDWGMYEMASQGIEKAQKEHLAAQRALAQAEEAKRSAVERGRQDLVVTLNNDIARHQEAIRETAGRFNECKAVIENAIQRYYIIWLSEFEKFSDYAMPLKSHSATVMPQKRHQDLPTYEASEPAIVPQQG